MLRLFMDKDGNGKLNGKELDGSCGASLIAFNSVQDGAWVLTAAHCIRTGSGAWPPKYKLMYVGGGSVDITKLEMKRIVLDKDHIIIHPKWTGPKFPITEADNGMSLLL